MRSVLSIIIVLLICTVVGLWSPWLQLNISISKLFGVEEPDSISGLEVYSLSGELEVYIDEEKAEGTAVFNESPLIIDEVEPGNRLIRIIRKSDFPDSYWSFSKLINFEQGKTVVITYNLGPEEQFSEGHVITVSKSDLQADSNRAVINFKANVSGANLFIDDAPFVITTKELSETLALNKQHIIKVEKPGYETLEFTILPKDQEDRDALKGYDINVDIYLMAQPILVE